MKHSLRIQTQLQNEFGFIVVYITERKIPKTILSVFSSNCTFLKSTKCLKDSSLYFFLILASIKKYPENDPTTFLTHLLFQLHQSEVSPLPKPK